MYSSHPLFVEQFSRFLSVMLNQLVWWISALITTYSETQDAENPPPVKVKPTTTYVHQIHAQSIRVVIDGFLSRCEIPFSVTQYDHNFHAACCREAHRKGYLVEDSRQNSLLSFLPGGVIMATTAYAHLTNQSTRIFIALYTGFLIYLDDVFQNDIDSVSCFNNNFIQRLPQKDPVLDGFASLLHEFPQHFGRLVSNIMITSTLNLVSALLLEFETRNMTVSSHARGFPTFSRVMSGASEAYALFAFPPEVPLPSYIQALPELMMFINNGNDVLSFYKEDLAGESVNRISNLSRCYETSKIEILQRLSQDAADCNSQVADILSPHPDAYKAYTRFSHGYIGFHASLVRYRLGELFCEY
ncbi:isoprenoid synthase domain-containing protein [Infundibulicybe gibba]|nr:isoprenoid synthase domain-containing protein [Infundibulicybe gibba]